MNGDDRIQVREILDLLRDQEALRKELREQDQHWRARMEVKTDRMYERLDDVARCVQEMPTGWGADILACQQLRAAATAAAVKAAADRAAVTVWWKGKLTIAIASFSAAGGIVAILRALGVL